MTEIDSALIAARSEFYDQSLPHREFQHYVRQYGLELGPISGFAGATGILSVVDCGRGRFDWDASGEMIQAFICEAYAEDGETVVDLVAWPVNQPGTVLTMFGRASLLGMWEAKNPATFYGGRALRMHRTPLEWLQDGCRGAAVVHPGRAARVLFELEGAIVGKDERHRRQLLDLVRSVVDDRKVVSRDEAWVA